MPDQNVQDVDLSSFGAQPVHGGAAAPSVSPAGATAPASGKQDVDLSAFGAKTANVDTRADQGDYLSKTEDAIDATVKSLPDVAAGFVKGAGQTVNTVSGLLNKIPVIGEYLAPSAGVKSATSIETPTNTAQKVGVGIEGLAEWMVTAELGGAAVKAMSASEKLGAVAKAAKFLESNPRMARILGNTAMGAVQPLAHGASGNDALGSGAVAGLTSGAIEGAGRLLGTFGDAADRIQDVSDLKNGFSKQQAVSVVKDNIKNFENTMHSEYESTLADMSHALEDQRLPLNSSPLAAAARELSNTEPASSLSREVQSLADPENAAQLNVDDLIKYRQRFAKLARGNTAYKNMYITMRNAADDSIETMTKESGESFIADEYSTAKQLYKERLGVLDSVPNSIKNGETDSLFKALTGNNSFSKVQAVKEALGGNANPANQDKLAASVLTELLTDSLDDSGKSDFSQAAKKYFSINPETRQLLFDRPGSAINAKELIDQVIDVTKAKTAIKLGLLGAGSYLGVSGYHSQNRFEEMAGALALLGGGLGVAGNKPVDAFIEHVVNSPTTWKFWRQASNISKSIPANGVLPAAASQVTHIFNPETGQIDPIAQ